ncbi:MAG: hypothetical protein CMP63_07955 [Flavobacteriales bacterium]|nr:hypothetical protein [Flavobacteriales bacterium]|tara:strand:+ start:1275 stop:2543 length:1269 start_codon:yes stop_codon:yes gene_type:complete
MKKITLIFAGIFSAFSMYGQVIDTVSTGASYVNDVYYSLENGEIHSVERENWDIAFASGGYGSTILTNEGSGTSLYFYSGGDTSAWSSIDTSGISGWTKYYNSDSTWSIGAFSQTSTGDYDPVFNTYDMGWGVYSMDSHVVSGDSLFVIKLSNGNFKKLWIDRLQSGVYYFKYADLDGSNLVHDTVVKSQYVNKNFAYYSIQNSTKLDREPENSTWDLLFTKYNTPVNSQYGLTPYGVTGVLSNEGVQVNKVSGVHNEDADTLSTSFVSDIASIGWSWKSLNYSTFQYEVGDSTTHFVKTTTGDVWKLVMTGFGGSANGNYYFTKEKMLLSVDAEESLTVLDLSTYPNPATDFLNIVLHQNNADDLYVSVYTLSGSLVYSSNFAGNAGLNNLQLNVRDFSKGLYLINVENQELSVQQKFVVK